MIMQIDLRTFYLFQILLMMIKKDLRLPTEMYR